MRMIKLITCNLYFANNIVVFLALMKESVSAVSNAAMLTVTVEFQSSRSLHLFLLSI